jgi:polar amino acid transport system permease protein
MSEALALLSFGDTGWGDEFLRGAWITITLALAALPLGLVLGLGIALMGRSESRLARAVATLYTTVFRGVPELLTLYMIAFLLPVAISAAAEAVGYGGRIEIPNFLAAAVALGMVVGAFSAEVWAGALNAIAKGQYEAAAALGLSPRHTFRHVVFPQLLRVALPGIGNNWLVLLKDTSLASVITLQDTMFWATRGNVTEKEPILFFLTAALIYLFFTILSQLVIEVGERRLNRAYGARR